MFNSPDDIIAQIRAAYNELSEKCINKVLQRYLGRELIEADFAKIQYARYEDEVEEGSEQCHLIYNFMDLGIIRFVYPDPLKQYGGGAVCWLPYHKPIPHPPIPRIMITFFE